MSQRLEHTFQAARQAGKTLLCPCLTAGYPNAASTVRLLQAAQRAGVGCVELGIPFSDPVADGPVIQASFTEALRGGITVAGALEIVREARARGVSLPIVAMVSFSVVFKRGTREFAQAAAAAGLDGLILPDLPLEEARGVVEVLREYGLASSLLVAPSTPPQRRKEIAALCTGFVYYLSVSGITGERRELPVDIAPNVAALRELTSVPICVGFGIATAAQVRQVTEVADGAIVGSALIRRIHETLPQGEAAMEASVEALMGELSSGLRVSA